jgi:HK97 family phage prohead protease
MSMQFSTPIEIMELKADGEEWEVTGYVSTFGNIDLGGDKVMPGAFKGTLKNGPKVRFLKSHDPDQILGTPKKLSEDDKGLLGVFKISKTQLGADTRQLLLDGALDSFSIGYNAVKWSMTDEDVRELHEVRLWESSLVSMPMNQDARVTRVKSLADKTVSVRGELENLLMEVRGLLKQDRPLTETKRKELTELLEMFSGFDAVRQEFATVLTPPPLHGSLVTMRKLANKRKLLENILQEKT